MLSTPLALSDLWPEDALFVPRVPDDSLDWLPSGAWPDRSTGASVVYTGALPIACHEAAALPAARQLLRDCGFRLPRAIVTYGDFAELRSIVAHRVERGQRVGVAFGSRHPLVAPRACVNCPELVAEINDKGNLACFVPRDALPERRVVPREEVGPLLRRADAAFPVILKAATRLGTGGGMDVAICRTAEDLTPAAEKLARAERIVVERLYAFPGTWCLHFAAADAGVVYLGATEQVCDDAGEYHGNWCDAAGGPDRACVEAARSAAEMGWQRGYRGFIGIDAGRAPDGRWLVFDLNFRTNGSTGQVLLRDSLATNWGARVTRLCIGVPFEGCYAAMVDALWALNRRRKIVPLSLCDSRMLDAEDPRPVCSMLVAGASRAEVEAARADAGAAGFSLD